MSVETRWVALLVELLFLFNSVPSSCWLGVRLSNLEEPTVNSLEAFFKKGSMSEDPSRLGHGLEAPLEDRDEGLCSSELEVRELHNKEEEEEEESSSLLTEHTAATKGTDTAANIDDPSEAALVAGAAEQVNCPICGMALTDDNTALNQHIDLCLNRVTVSQVARCRTPPHERPPEAPTLPQPSSSSSKGRKREQKTTPEKAKRSKVHSPTHSMKLDKYFK